MDLIESPATASSLRPSVDVGRTCVASAEADRDERDVGSTLLRVVDVALIVAMIAAPLVLTTLTPSDTRQEVQTASVEQTAQASAP